MFAEAPGREIYVLLSRSTESESEVRIEIFRRGGCVGVWRGYPSMVRVSRAR